ncbi:hypothetical protein Shyhy02_68560 [Streptomyces hygroscopicus subsp. hygroscopicus]|nr:hypothetical protein Shyhy02_68560 [Streptomyces hygroscopicus subsp. hygroscopicus]
MITPPAEAAEAGAGAADDVPRALATGEGQDSEASGVPTERKAPEEQKAPESQRDRAQTARRVARRARTAPRAPPPAPRSS